MRGWLSGGHRRQRRLRRRLLELLARYGRQSQEQIRIKRIKQDASCFIFFKGDIIFKNRKENIMGNEGRVQLDDDAMVNIVGGVLITSTTVTNKDTGEVWFTGTVYEPVLLEDV